MKNRWQMKVSDYDEIGVIDRHLSKINWLPLHDKNILITGCNGMLGMCLTNLVLRAYKLELFTPKNIYLASRDWTESHLELIHDGSIHYVTNSEIELLDLKIDHIFHTASPAHIGSINSLEDTLRINSLAGFDFSKIEGLMFISSGEIYLGKSTSTDPKASDFTLNGPRDIYPYSKFQAESNFRELATRFGFKLTIIRLFHCFGPGFKHDDKRTFSDFIWGASRSRQVNLHSQGGQIRSFLYILDACFGVLQGYLDKNSPIAMNVGSDEPITILEFANKVAELTESELKIELGNEKIPPSPFDSIVPNIQTLRNIGWEPKYNLDFAIKRTFTWASATLEN
jgi:nucleoside-diphosphate-sugar epimerase